MPDEITFQNDPVDPSLEFRKQHNHFFVAERAESLEPERAAGEILWRRMSLIQRVSYHQVTPQLEDYAVWKDQPEGEYADEQAFPFVLDFISPRCVRLRTAVRPADDRAHQARGGGRRGDPAGRQGEIAGCRPGAGGAGDGGRRGAAVPPTAPGSR